MKRLMIAACCGMAITTAAFAQSSPLSAWGTRAELYDPSAPVLLRGKVLQADFIGPYASLSLMHAEPSGREEQWAVDLGETRTLAARRMDRATLKPGALVVVRAYQAKDRTRRAAAIGANVADGRRIHTGTGAPRAGTGS